MKKKTTTDKSETIHANGNWTTGRGTASPRLIIDDATDRDYERGTDRKQRIAAPEGSVMIF